MTPIGKFIQELSMEDKIEIIKNYKELKVSGSIGECVLRTKAEEFAKLSKSIFDAFSMEIFALNVAVEFADKYIDLMDEKEPYIAVSPIISEIRDNSQTWHDSETNLTWEEKTQKNATHRYVWGKENIPNAWNPEALTDDVKDTQSYIEKLNKENFGGFSDWRLPTLDELKDLYSKREIIEKGYYWTASSWTGSTSNYWVWNGTSTSLNHYNDDYYVRCVR